MIRYFLWAEYFPQWQRHCQFFHPHFHRLHPRFPFKMEKKKKKKLRNKFLWKNSHYNSLVAMTLILFNFFGMTEILKMKKKTDMAYSIELRDVDLFSNCRLF